MQGLYGENEFDNDLFITSANRWSPNHRTLRNTLIKICKRANIPEYTIHSIRHRFATDIVRKAKYMGELKDVAELIGDSYEVIINTYFHTDNGKKIDLIDAIIDAA